MLEITLPTERVIPTFNALYSMQQWLRPGSFSFLLGCYIDVLRGHAERLQMERSKLISELATKYPDVYPLDYSDKALRGKPHPSAGNPVVETVAGMTTTRFPSAIIAREFAERDKALMEGSIEVHVFRKLTPADWDRMDQSLIRLNGKEHDLAPPDLSWLMPFVDFTPTE